MSLTGHDHANQATRQRTLSFVLGPTALAALAFENANRHAIPGIHDPADQSWLSAAPAPEFVIGFGARQFSADKVHDSLPKRGTTYLIGLDSIQAEQALDNESLAS